MANHEEAKKDKDGIPERLARLSRNVHIAIGAVALAGAVIFPQVELFSTVFTLAAISTIAHEGLRQELKSRREGKQNKLKPKPA